MKLRSSTEEFVSLICRAEGVVCSTKLDLDPKQSQEAELLFKSQFLDLNRLICSNRGFQCFSPCHKSIARTSKTHSMFASMAYVAWYRPPQRGRHSWVYPQEGLSCRRLQAPLLRLNWCQNVSILRTLSS